MKCCDSISGEMWEEKCLLIPEPTADQSKDTTKVQRSERMSFIGVSYKNMHGGFWELKWLKDSCINKAHPSTGDISQKL